MINYKGQKIMRTFMTGVAVVLSLIFVMVKSNGAPTEHDVNWRQATFTDQNGAPFKLSSLNGKPTILSFAFTCCSASCPAQMVDLSFLQKTLNKEFGKENYQILTVSMAPKFDTAENLKRFGGRFQIDYENWHIVVGDKVNTDALIADAGFQLTDFSTESCADFDHGTDLYIIDANGKFHSKIAGLPLSETEFVSVLADMKGMSKLATASE